MAEAEENEIIRIFNSLESDLQRKALSLRGVEAYREYPRFSINRVREAKQQVKGLMALPSPLK